MVDVRGIVRGYNVDENDELGFSERHYLCSCLITPLTIY